MPKTLLYFQCIAEKKFPAAAARHTASRRALRGTIKAKTAYPVAENLFQVPRGSSMHFNPYSAIGYCWDFLGIIWIIGIIFTKPTLRAQSAPARLLYIVLTIVGGLLIAGYFFPGSVLDAHFVPHTYAIATLGFALTVAGCLFAVWARVTLGTNWSGRPMVKAGHELVVRGPYALARHPIYTGLLLALAGTIVAYGQWRGIAGFFVVVLGLLVKISQEEKLMMETFPQEYPGYRQRVKALIPGLL
jgi:protein-S-isoprenylcysteine O-methyltransferase Ste14